jgi:hypothetical protein
LGQDIIALRGYEDNQITPPYPNQAGQSNIRGGIVYDKFGLELRYPITTGSAATIYGFTFVEAGNNWNNYEDFNPFSMYKTAGFGARIFMPAFGLIGLNWGYGFDVPVRQYQSRKWRQIPVYNRSANPLKNAVLSYYNIFSHFRPEFCQCSEVRIHRYGFHSE